eukprot:1954500-Rhodomonas_salina.1
MPQLWQHPTIAEAPPYRISYVLWHHPAVSATGDGGRGGEFGEGEGNGCALVAVPEGVRPVHTPVHTRGQSRGQG